MPDSPPNTPKKEVPLNRNKEALLTTDITDSISLDDNEDKSPVAHLESTFDPVADESYKTPIKQNKEPKPLVIADNRNDMLNIILSGSTAQNYHFDFKPYKKDSVNKYCPKDKKINADQHNDYTRYTLATLALMFALYPENTQLKARFVVVPTAELTMEILFSLDQNESGISHAQLALGVEGSCFCFAAGEIHFSKHDGAWFINEINNKTGHFLCDLKALILPLKLLINESLWRSEVTLAQIVNTKSNDKTSHERFNSYSFNLSDLKTRCDDITINLPKIVIPNIPGPSYFSKKTRTQISAQQGEGDDLLSSRSICSFFSSHSPTLYFDEADENVPTAFDLGY